MLNDLTFILNNIYHDIYLIIDIKLFDRCNLSISLFFVVLIYYFLE